MFKYMTIEKFLRLQEIFLPFVDAFVSTLGCNLCLVRIIPRFTKMIVLGLHK